MSRSLPHDEAGGTPASGRRRMTPVEKRLRACEISGWLLFTASAVCFVVASVGDPWALAGSLFFLVACGVFLIPYLGGR